MQLIELKGAFLYPTQSRDRYDENRVKYYMDLFSSGKEKPIEMMGYIYKLRGNYFSTEIS